MRLNCVYIFSFLLLFYAIDAHASADDSLKKEIRIPTVVQFTDDHAFDFPRPAYYSLDTTLNGIEYMNPASKENYNFLSNFGSAASPRAFSFPDNLLTDIGLHSYDLYLLNEKKIRYFKTNKTYSEINYHLAGGKEQQITIALSKNVFKEWNVGLDFNRFGSLGFMKNGTTYHSNLDLYSWVHSANQRYNLLAYAIWNSIQNEVNGGLHSDSLYNNSVVNDFALQGLQVNLDDAENHFRNRQFSLRQFYDFGLQNQKQYEDSTSRKNPVTKKVNSLPFRLEYSTNLEERSFTYLDVNPGDFYPHSFFTSTTKDSLHFFDFRNRVSLASFDLMHDTLHVWKPSCLTISWEHQWLKYVQYAYDNQNFLDIIMQNNALQGNLTNSKDSGKVFYAISGKYVFNGVEKNNYKAEISLQVPLKELGEFDFSGQVFQKSPEFVYQRYYSNHVIRDSPFALEKSKWKNAGGIYNLKKIHFSIGLEATTVSNYIYLDSTAAVVQTTDEIKIIKYHMRKDFRYRKIHLNNTILVQKVNPEALIHLPQIISTQSLFYESFLYNKALLLQCGFDLQYSSSYYADAFMPATGMFYQQSGTKTNGYPVIDFFVNFRIKSARFTLKLENIGDNLIENGYYLTPHYPMQGMTIKFGINWRFFDQ